MEVNSIPSFKGVSLYEMKGYYKKNADVIRLKEVEEKLKNYKNHNFSFRPAKNSRDIEVTITAASPYEHYLDKDMFNLSKSQKEFVEKFKNADEETRAGRREQEPAFVGLINLDDFTPEQIFRQIKKAVKAFNETFKVFN